MVCVWIWLPIKPHVNLEMFNNIEYLSQLECCCYDAFERVRSYVLFIGSMLDMCKAEQLVSKQFEAPYFINLFTDIPWLIQLLMQIKIHSPALSLHPYTSTLRHLYQGLLYSLGYILRNLVSKDPLKLLYFTLSVSLFPVNVWKQSLGWTYIYKHEKCRLSWFLPDIIIK